MFWLVSHVQYHSGGKVTPLQHGVTTALGSIWVVTFAVARVICAVCAVCQIGHILANLSHPNVPLFSALMLGPILVIHGSFEMIRSMSAGIVAGACTVYV